MIGLLTLLTRMIGLLTLLTRMIGLFAFKYGSLIFSVFLLVAGCYTAANTVDKYRIQMSSSSDNFHRLNVTDVRWAAPIVMASENITVYIRVIYIENEMDGGSSSIVQEFLAQNVSHATLRIMNSTWSKTYTSNTTFSENGLAQGWTISLLLDEITARDGLQEEFQTEISVMGLGGVLRHYGSMIDLRNGPMWLWSLGEELIVDVDIMTSGNLVIRYVPCSPDIVLLFVLNSTQGFYAAVSYGLFVENSTNWFNMTTAVNNSRIIDVAVTNHYIIAVTADNKILVSTEITTDITTPIDKVEFVSTTLPWDVASSSFFDWNTTKLMHTPTCVSTHSHTLPEHYDTDVFIIHHSPHEQISLTVYAEPPYDVWRKIEVSGFDTGDTSYVAIVHDAEQQSFVTLSYKTDDALYSVSVYTKPVWDPACSFANLTQKLFNVFHFPPGSVVTGLSLSTYGHSLFAFGSQIWLSLDGGGYFTSIDLSGNRDKAPLFISTVSDSSLGTQVFITDNQTLFIHKPGLSRVDLLPLEAESSDMFITTKAGLLIQITVGSNITAIVIDVDTILSTQNQVSHVPLAVFPVSNDEVLFFEHYADPPSSDPILSVGNIGQLIRARRGGSAVIVDEIKLTGNSAFRTCFKTKLISSFVYDTTSSCPALSNTLAIVIDDGSTLVTLDLLSASYPWSLGDVGKTVHVPGSNSFLITSVESDQSCTAAPVFPRLGTSYTTHPTGEWLMFDFGSPSSEEEVWVIVEPECVTTLEEVESSWAHHHGDGDGDHMIRTDLGQRLYHLDLGESLLLSVTASADESSAAVMGDHVTGSLTLVFGNPRLLDMHSHTSKHTDPTSNQLSVSLSNQLSYQGETSVLFSMTRASMICRRSSLSFTVQTSCPPSKYIIYIPDVYISKQTWLHGHPTDEMERPLLFDLPPNYRPPSERGVAIPLTTNVYNVHPDQTRPNDNYDDSQTSGTLKMCVRAHTRADCNCTDDMLVSTRVEYSDCKRRVRRLLHPGVLEMYLNLHRDGQPDARLSASSWVTLEELNDRSDYFIDPKAWQSESIVAVRQNVDSHRPFLIPNKITLTVMGSGLYHFKVKVIEGRTYCNLYEEIQIYVDNAPLPSSALYTIYATVATVIGSTLLVVYLFYLKRHHQPRHKSTGSECWLPEH